MKLSEEEGAIDWNYLVRVTDGYSGADITNVCRDAAMMPMRRKLLSSQFDINNIHAMQEEIDVPLTMSDFKEAIKNVQKSVSQEQLTSFQEWMKQFGSVWYTLTYSFYLSFTNIYSDSLRGLLHT